MYKKLECKNRAYIYLLDVYICEYKYLFVHYKFISYYIDNYNIK